MSSERSRLANIRMRNDFYKLSFRRTIWVLLVSFVINILLVMTILVMRMHKTPPITVTAITDNGQMISLHPTLQGD